MERPPAWEPLPSAAAGEIIGLLEVLDDRGGRENVFALVEDLGRDFGTILNVVKAGELLDFVDTPRQEVVLTDVGRRFLSGSIPERKRIFREQVRQLRMFGDVVDQIRRSEKLEMDVDVLQSALALHLPLEDNDRTFRTIVDWGRHADLFDHDPEREKIGRAHV